MGRFLFMQVEPIPSVVDSWLPIYVGIVTACAALLGVAITGLITYFVKKSELKYGSKETNRALVIARLEDLHERVFLITSMSADVMTGYLEMRSRRSESRKELGELLAPSSRAITKINSLLIIYAKELEPDLKELYVLWDAMMTELNSFMVNTRIPSTNLLPLQAKVAAKCRDIGDKVGNKIQNYLSF